MMQEEHNFLGNFDEMQMSKEAGSCLPLFETTDKKTHKTFWRLCIIFWFCYTDHDDHEDKQRKESEKGSLGQSFLDCVYASCSVVLDVVMETQR